MSKFVVFGTRTGNYQIINAPESLRAEEKFLEGSGEDDNALAISLRLIKKIAKENE
jgi:hypothetical protein